MNESSPIRTDTARAYQPGEAPAREVRTRRSRPIRWLVILMLPAGAGAIGHRWYEARTDKGAEPATAHKGGGRGG
ncbi:efflux transporter periplasmic adaptor subunit, partial [Methylobacterium fujisawaense]